MLDGHTRWWILQVELPERHPQQMDIFSPRMRREELLRQAFEHIPGDIRATRSNLVWGLANLVPVNSDVLAARLTVRPPFSGIGEESVPGHLEEPREPRFYTQIVVDLPSQYIAVHRAAEVTRFARTAKSFGEIFRDLLSQAVHDLEMEPYYRVEVEAIGRTGSFLEWYRGLDQLDKLAVHYIGPNLPSRPDGLVESIKKTANELRNRLRSDSVDLIANDPTLTDEDVMEVDRAVADRKLRLRAKGKRAGVGTSWSSSTEIRPETPRIPVSDDELRDLKDAAAKVVSYLEEYLPERKP